MDAIAVVSMACRFPGGVTSPEELWRLLERGGDAIQEVPPSRWPVDLLYSADPEEPGKISSKWAGYVEGVEDFDAGFFGLSPAEAEQMDPQQRMLMEVAYEAMERAGLPPGGDQARDCGVFVGISTSDYGRALGKDLTGIGPYFSTGQALSIAANRISYTWDLRGPSLAVDTACSSGLVAVDLAVQSLRRGACSIALAGAVNLVLGPENWVSLSKFGMMSTDGRCRSFGAGGDGFVRSDGCAVVLLKPLAAAERDGDEILAVILGSAVNQDGRSNGLTAPNGTAQETVIRNALTDAGLPAEAVTYVEAHGSGTALGDPIEMGALARTYGVRPSGVCRVGSVKSNLGHAEAAAGIAGLAKLILCLGHRHLPASLHAQPPNPRLSLDGTNVEVVSTGTPWTGDRPLIGAVSSFGFGGTNAHMIVAAAPAKAAATPARQRDPLVLPLSARSPAALRALAERYAESVETNPPTDVCYSAAVRRAHHPHRAAVVAQDREQLLQELRNLPEPEQDGEPWRDPVFVFDGQSHLPTAPDLLDEPVFSDVVARCEPIFQRPLRAMLAGDQPIPPGTDTAQAVLFTFQTGLTDVWRSLGLRPTAVVGHSAGETAAAYAAGLLDLESAARLAAARGSAMRLAHGRGRMAVVSGPPDQAAKHLGEDVVIAAYNSHDRFVISGRDLDKATRALRLAGFSCHPLPGDYAFHSPRMRDAAEKLAAADLPEVARVGTALYCSTVLGAVTDGDALDAAYWGRGITEPVRFHQAIQALLQFGFGSFLELGARPTHAADIVGTADRRVRVIQAHRDGGVAHPLAQLYRAGADLDWASRYPEGTFLPGLPTYPWQRARHWAITPWHRDHHRAITPWQRDHHRAITKEYDMHGDTVATIKERLAGHLKLGAADISDHAAFLDLGADSLVLMKLVTYLNERYGSDLQPSMLFETYPTVRALATELGSFAEPAAAALVAEPAVAAPGSVAGTVVAAPAPAVETGSSVSQLFSEQLAIMREQLRLLNPSSANGEIQPERDLPPAPAKPVPRAVPHKKQEPLTEPQRRYVADLVEQLSERDESAKKLAGTYRPRLAESRPWANFRPELKELIVPFVAERAEGARLWDTAGNAYTDYCMGFGVQLLGHNPPFVTEALRRQLGQTYSLGYQLKQTYELADQFCQVTGHDRVTFCNTGSEAVMGAIRLARLATGRGKIAYFERSYHGLTDSVLAGTGAPGLSQGAMGEAVVLPYGDEDSLRQLRSVAGELAAVLVEPVQNRNPSVQPAAFLAELRRLATEHGIVLIFDEMITGFRIGLRGAQGYFGVTPDLSTYGKIIGGGLPIAAIAGRADLMAGMDGGTWEYGDDSGPTAQTTLFGGTFQKHPLAVSAARAVLDHLETGGPELYEQLNARAARITDGLTEIFQAESLPYSIASFGSLWRMEYRGTASFQQPLPMEMLYHSLLAEGVHVWEGRTFFLSTAHDDGDAQQLLDAVERCVGGIRRGGFLPAREPLEWQATPQQRQLWQLQRDHGPEWSAYHETILLRLRGELDTTALGDALRYVARRHPALTASFTGDGTLLRRELDATVELRLAEGNDPGPWTRPPFSLDQGPLFRAALLRQAPDLHILVLCGHHLVLDGISAGLVIDDLTEAYTRAVRGGPLPPAIAQVPALSGEPITVTPRRPDPHDFEPAVRREFGLPDWREVRARAKREGRTPFMLAFGAFCHALHEVTGRDELSVGVHVDRRTDQHAFAGHFLDVVAVTSRAGERLDLTQLTDSSSKPSPEVDVVFDLNPALPTLAWPGLDVELASPPAVHAKYGLFFDVLPIADTGRVEVTYRAPYDETLIEPLYRQWISSLKGH